MRKILLAILLVTSVLGLRAQQLVTLSVRDVAPDFGVRAQFLDDTVHFIRFVDSLPPSNQQRTDSCVSLNSRLLALQNTLRYDYRHSGDTLWLDGATFINDYADYAQRIETLSALVMRRAHHYIDCENILRDSIRQSTLSSVRDSIGRQHRTIVNASDGIGVTDRARQKELKDIYYAYLSVYNRYDFSMRRGDSAYIADLQQFSRFQQHIISHLLGNNNYSARINNFSNTLKLRCGRTHTEVYRSYQRVFLQRASAVQFSTLPEYYDFADSQQQILDIQEDYLKVVDLREKISANSKRIDGLYSPKFHDVARTYQEAAATINTIPAFTTTYDADEFLASLQEWIQVQESYLHDYQRLNAIVAHADTLTKRCSLKYMDIAKAYRQLSAQYSITPSYRTLDDAVRYAEDLSYFELMQRQYDSILDLRMLLDRQDDSISRGWVSHFNIYTGYQSIRKQYATTPSFINSADGSKFIASLQSYIAMQQRTLQVIGFYEQYHKLNDEVSSAIQPYRNMRKAYANLEKAYLTISRFNHIDELNLYGDQLEAFITVQQAVIKTATGSSASSADLRLKGLKDVDRIELIFGL